MSDSEHAREQLKDLAEDLHHDGGMFPPAIVRALHQTAADLEDLGWFEDPDLRCNRCGAPLKWGDEYPDPEGIADKDEDALCPYCHRRSRAGQ